MKNVFSFLTGAVIGAGSLLGLKKALQALDKSEKPGGPGKSQQESPAVPVKEVKKDSTPVEANQVATAPAAAPITLKASPSDEGLDAVVSLVGEPVERHKEPVAATESDPAATTPRSETAEPAILDEVTVKPAADSTPLPESTPDSTPLAKPAANSARNQPRSNGSKKNSRNSAKPKTDDFTVVSDIGPVFNQKLHEAGINSFRDFVSLTPAEVAAKTGIPVERIERGKWLEQVQKLITDNGK